MDNTMIQRDLNGVVADQPSAERANIAFELEKKLIGLKQTVARNFLEIGKVLKQIRDDGLFQDLGYSTTTEWLKSPEISLSERWAWAAISIYETFVEKLKMDFEEVAKIDYSKLYEISSLVRNNPEDAEKWIDAAKSMRKIDLRREIQEHKISEQEKLVVPTPENNSIMLGDAITNLLSMKSNTVDAVITDPPQGEGDFHMRWISQAYRVLSENGSLVVMTNKQNLLKIASVMDSLNLKLVNTIAWVFEPENVTVERINPAHNLILWASKGIPQCNTRDVTTDVWQIKPTHKFDHPEEKPEELLEKLIELATHPSQVVLDPFIGSGTTMVVAKKLGRQYRGVEISEFWYKIALERTLKYDKLPL